MQLFIVLLNSFHWICSNRYADIDYYGYDCWLTVFELDRRYGTTHLLAHACIFDFLLPSVYYLWFELRTIINIFWERDISSTFKLICLSHASFVTHCLRYYHLCRIQHSLCSNWWLSILFIPIEVGQNEASIATWYQCFEPLLQLEDTCQRSCLSFRVIRRKNKHNLGGYIYSDIFIEIKDTFALKLKTLNLYDLWRSTA